MKTVLIVDDDEDQHTILQTLLRHNGYSTLHARSIGDAREVLADTRPDAILLDILLPGRKENGLDLLFALHVSDPSLPVVIVTADALAAHRYPKALSTAAGWLLKPVFTSDVLETVRRVTERA